MQWRKLQQSVQYLPARFEEREEEDLPGELRSILVENGDGPGPFGAKGIGESGLMPTAPAIANALARAIGVRLKELPLTPERVRAAIAG